MLFILRCFSAHQSDPFFSLNWSPANYPPPVIFSHHTTATNWGGWMLIHASSKICESSQLQLLELPLRQESMTHYPPSATCLNSLWVANVTVIPSIPPRGRRFFFFEIFDMDGCGNIRIQTTKMVCGNPRRSAVPEIRSLSQMFEVNINWSSWATPACFVFAVKKKKLALFYLLYSQKTWNT